MAVAHRNQQMPYGTNPTGTSTTGNKVKYMKKHHSKVNDFCAAALLLLTCSAQAGVLTVPNSFTSGTPAVATEVNQNFTAVKTEVDDNDGRIALLEATLATLQTTITSLQNTVTAQAATITNLQSQLATVNNSNVMALNPYLTVDTSSDPRGPLLQFSSVNMQLINGTGSTASANGLGNLIVGYDEADSSGISRCSIGWYYSGGVATDASNCAAAGGTWTSAGFKSGSHYLITGSQNNYSRWGGLMTGRLNTSNYNYASVSGGENNTASGPFASVSGGYDNISSGNYASVSGGSHNTSSGNSYASISGGASNTASGNFASVNGGSSNTASGDYSSVSGGVNNTASGSVASVSGGAYNTASGAVASVNGGGSGSSPGGNTAATNYSTILGGTGKTTTTVSESLP